MVTIKEYAEKHGVSIQAVYQQLKRKQNKAFLSQHIEKIDGVTYLDPEAVAFLESKRENSPSVIVRTAEHEVIEQLTQENKNLLIKVAQLQEVIITKSEKIEQLQEANILLLEEEKQNSDSNAGTEETEKKKGWLSRFFSQ
ncbi:MAG: hypothetical protein Q8N88_05800 [Nanoarchaeota archaeon]|jgi:hypothetical protein|nr:hypothetical protein [Nanoarchaeota archaeon]